MRGGAWSQIFSPRYLERVQFSSKKRECCPSRISGPAVGGRLPGRVVWWIRVWRWIAGMHPDRERGRSKIDKLGKSVLEDPSPLYFRPISADILDFQRDSRVGDLARGAA